MTHTAIGQDDASTGERLRGQAEDMRTIAQELHNQGKDGPARLTERGAQYVERLSGHLHDTDADQMPSDVEGFARSKPWLIAAGSAVLGFAGSRLLKASSRQRYQAAARRGPSAAKEAMRNAASRAGHQAGQASSRLTDATPSADEVKQGARRAVGMVQENPLGLAIGAAATGFLAGLLLPKTRVEDERLGGLADQVKGAAQQTGQEAMERGRQVAQAATQTVKQQAQEQGQDLAGGARPRAEEMGQRTRRRSS